MTIREACILKSYQIQECQEYADFDMVIEHLEFIPRRVGIDTVNCEMFDKMKDSLIQILSQYDWIDPLYDTIEEVKSLEAEEDAYIDTCELKMNADREARFMTV